MTRDILKNEEIIFQEGDLTFTNKRIWQGSESKSSFNLRVVPLHEVAEITLSYKRPFMGLIFTLLSAVAIFWFTAMLPNKIAWVVNITPYKNIGFSLAFLTAVVGVWNFFAGASLSFSIATKRGKSFDIQLAGAQADKEKYLTHLKKMEAALVESSVSGTLRVVPPLPNVA
jgi:hypothetical protein